MLKGTYLRVQDLIFFFPSRNAGAQFPRLTGPRSLDAAVTSGSAKMREKLGRWETVGTYNFVPASTKKIWIEWNPSREIPLFVLRAKVPEVVGKTDASTGAIRVKFDVHVQVKRAGRLGMGESQVHA